MTVIPKRKNTLYVSDPAFLPNEIIHIIYKCKYFENLVFMYMYYLHPRWLIILMPQKLLYLTCYH